MDFYTKTELKNHGPLPSMHNIGVSTVYWVSSSFYCNPSWICHVLQACLTLITFVIFKHEPYCHIHDKGIWPYIATIYYGLVILMKLIIPFWRKERRPTLSLEQQVEIWVIIAIRHNISHFLQVVLCNISQQNISNWIEHI